MTANQVCTLPNGGRSTIQPPDCPGWLASEVQAVAGVQFVMRMQHHACEKISASSAEGRSSNTGLRHSRQRFSEMDQWAIWAHEAIRDPSGPLRLSPGMISLSNVLAVAGFELAIESDVIVVKHSKLDRRRPRTQSNFNCGGSSHPNRNRPTRIRAQCSRKDRWPMPTIRLIGRTGKRTVIVFDPPVPDVLTQELGEPDKSHKRQQQRNIRWIVVVPKADRPMPSPYSDIDPLTQDLRRVVRAYREHITAPPPRRECSRMTYSRYAQQFSGCCGMRMSTRSESRRPAFPVPRWPCCADVCSGDACRNLRGQRRHLRAVCTWGWMRLAYRPELPGRCWSFGDGVG